MHPEDTPVPLSILCLELDATPDQLARYHHDQLTHDAIGRRALPASRARELVEAANRKRYEQAEAERKRRAEWQERYREIRRKHPIPKGVALDVEGTMTPALAMVAADGAPRYEGGTYRPVPGAADWAFNSPEGGASLGPTRSEMLRQARARSEARKAKKGGDR